MCALNLIKELFLESVRKWSKVPGFRVAPPQTEEFGLHGKIWVQSSTAASLDPVTKLTATATFRTASGRL